MKAPIIILRGTSSSGKSTVAELIAKPSAICCADDYFTDAKGNYNFDPNKLKDAHAQCRQKFEEALKDKHNFYKNIIISNTNTTEREWKYYEDRAKEEGRKVFFLVIERRHDNVNSHGVPEEVLENQEKRLRNNLKLR